jgi:predicted TIM-barrel fold metal-dependent hydrolase
MKSFMGIEVVDAHAHFFTFNTLKTWRLRGRTRDGFEKRTRTRTDMKQIMLPEEGWDVARMWVNELDKYRISAMGFMISREVYGEFLEARRRFPGRFMGYANIYPGDDDAVERVKKAGRDGLQGIKLYPSTWRDFHVYDEVCYPVYEEALNQGLVVFIHFGITIGGQADLRHGNPLDIQVPSRDFPDLTFVIVHFGAGFFRELLLMQYQADNVLMDTSGSNSWMRYMPYDLDLEKVFEKAVKAGGPEKIIFGTDSTFFPRGFRHNILRDQHEALKHLVRKSYLSEEDMDLIFKENILKLTGFKPSK